MKQTSLTVNSVFWRQSS